MAIGIHLMGIVGAPLTCEFWGISNRSAPDMATPVYTGPRRAPSQPNIPGQRPNLHFGLWTTSIRTLKTRSPEWAVRHRHEPPRAFLGRHVIRGRVTLPQIALHSRRLCGAQLGCSPWYHVPLAVPTWLRIRGAATSRCQVFLNHLLIHASACASRRHFVAALSAMPRTFYV